MQEFIPKSTLAFFLHDTIITWIINPDKDSKFDAGENELKRAIENGETNPAEIPGMNMIGQLRKNPGNWMISRDRNGGYAYAKVCSNGISP